MSEIKKILVTGCAGFIGYHTTKELLKREYEVIGLDILNDYYDVRLKDYRLDKLINLGLSSYDFQFYRADIRNEFAIFNLLRENKVDAIINFAAMAGVENSIKNPELYFDTNLQGTLKLLKMCELFGIKKFIQASTSGIYAGQKMPFIETLALNTPISPYTASKKCVEVLGHTYSYLYDI